MKFVFSTILFVFAVVSSWAQSVTIPDKISVPTGRLGAIKISYDGDDIRWHVSSGIDCFREYDPGTKVIRLRVLGYRAGTYELVAVTCKAGKLSDFARCIIVVGVPPGPTPTPPDPTPPKPGPAPIDEPGLHVLIVYESKDKANYPSGQFAAIYGKQVRDYLQAKCAKEPDGNPARRIYDKDVNVSADLTVWQKAMARPRTTLPWIIVSNGKEGFEGPLPESLDDIMKLLRKYGG